MFIALFTVAALTAFAAMSMLDHANRMFATAPASPVHANPRSPLDHAERILAQRYAKGEITPEEYDRMLAILRR